MLYLIRVLVSEYCYLYLCTYIYINSLEIIKKATESAQFVREHNV